MRGGIIGLALAVWPAVGGAQDWRPLDGPAIRAALAARVLGHADGTLQDFFADGRTLSGSTSGTWKVEGDTLCTLWPPSQQWTCARVEAASRGLDLRFTGPDGRQTAGRYVDLG